MENLQKTLLTDSFYKFFVLNVLIDLFYFTLKDFELRTMQLLSTPSELGKHIACARFAF